MTENVPVQEKMMVAGREMTGNVPVQEKDGR